jgi:hypothetical protein
VAGNIQSIERVMISDNAGVVRNSNVALSKRMSLAPWRRGRDRRRRRGGNGT